jgi:hypothetical protein
MFRTIKRFWTRYVLRRELTRLVATENAARRVLPAQRKNPSFVSKFPRGIHK